VRSGNDHTAEEEVRQNAMTCQHGRGASAYILSAHQQMKGRKPIPPTQANNRACHQPEKTANPRPYRYTPQHTRNSCRAGEYFVLVSFTFNLASGHHRNSTALHFDSQRLPGTRHRGLYPLGPPVTSPENLISVGSPPGYPLWPTL